MPTRDPEVIIDNYVNERASKSLSTTAETISDYCGNDPAHYSEHDYPKIETARFVFEQKSDQNVSYKAKTSNKAGKNNNKNKNWLNDAIVAFKKAQSSNRIRQAFRAKLKMSVGPFKRALVFVSNPGCLRRLFEPDIEAENLIQELNT